MERPTWDGDYGKGGEDETMGDEREDGSKGRSDVLASLASAHDVHDYPVRVQRCGALEKIFCAHAIVVVQVGHTSIHVC